MRVVLADLKSDRGFVSKDTVVGGYGSRLDPFSRVTRIMAYLKKQFHDVAERPHGLHRGDPGARRPRRDVDARRAGRRRRRARAVVAGRSQERNGVGRSDARARRQGRVHRHHGVEDAASCSTATATSSSTASRKRPSCGWRRATIPRGIVVSEQIDDLDSLPFPRWDLVTEDRGAGVRHQVVVAAGRRRLSAARQPRLPRVLHLLPAPHPRRLPRAIDREHRGRARAAVRSAPAAVRDLPRSAVQRTARSVPRAVRRDPARGLTLTFEAETRLDRLDVELLDRLYAAGFRAMSFGVESTDPATLQEVGAPADSAGASARDHRALPHARASSPRRSTCSASCRTTGARSPRRSTTPPISARRSRSSRS